MIEKKQSEAKSLFFMLQYSVEWFFFIIFTFLSLFEGFDNYKLESGVNGLVVAEDYTKTHVNPLDIM